ncbi:MAG: hypothetical protein AB1894_15895 [Chloroflexota bacterium]
MPIQIDVSDDDIKYFNDRAKQELKNVSTDYAQEVIREANRLEANIKTTQGNPEITSSHVKDASTVISRRFINPRKHWWFYAIKTLAIIGALITGFAFDKLSETWGPILFALAVVITTILTTIQTVNE